MYYHLCNDILLSNDGNFGLQKWLTEKVPIWWFYLKKLVISNRYCIYWYFCMVYSTKLFCFILYCISNHTKKWCNILTTSNFLFLQFVDDFVHIQLCRKARKRWCYWRVVSSLSLQQLCFKANKLFTKEAPCFVQPW